MGSVLAHGLNCPTDSSQIRGKCRFFANQESNLCPLQQQVDSTSAPPGKSFSLALIFDNLTMIYLGMVFFAFDSFSFLDLCFCFHNVWDISALFLQTFFFVPISFYFSWDSNYICFRLCACFFFFFFNVDYRNLFFLRLSCLFLLQSFYCSFFKFIGPLFFSVYCVII